MPKTLTTQESLNSIKEYINELDDMEYAINNLTWALQPSQLNLLHEAGQSLTLAIELLKQCLETPEKVVIKFD